MKETLQLKYNLTTIQPSRGSKLRKMWKINSPECLCWSLLYSSFFSFQLMWGLFSSQCLSLTHQRRKAVLCCFFTSVPSCTTPTVGLIFSCIASVETSSGLIWKHCCAALVIRRMFWENLKPVVQLLALWMQGMAATLLYPQQCRMFLAKWWLFQTKSAAWF